MKNRVATLLITLTTVACVLSSTSVAADQPAPQATVQQINDAKLDILAEAAMKQPGGASYDFFAAQLPPLRYVDADFHHYPITLSSPGALVKARFVSNGSAVNARARQFNWQGEAGVPFEFFVGDRRELFGSDLKRLTGPKYADGYLPIVQLAYESGQATYAQETFVSVDPQFDHNAAVFESFELRKGDSGNLEVKFDNDAYRLFKFDQKTGQLRYPDGKLLGLFNGEWKFYPGRGALSCDLKSGRSVRFVVFTEPVEPGAVSIAADAQSFQKQRDMAVEKWNSLLQTGMTVSVAEPVVNNAWRAAIIGDYALLHGDEIRYSQGNQYAKLYIGEGGDAVRSIALWGHSADARRMMLPQFHYTRKNLEFHQAALKLQMLAHYYRLTRDDEFIRENRPLWEKELNVILNGRKTENGMLPREKYCGDIDTMVFSLNSNSNCWRALRDMSVLLSDIGEKERAQALSETAGEYRRIILDNLEKAIRRDVTPPFVPVALSGEESPCDPIWGTVMGSYWNLMIEYILGSGVFTADSQPATDIMQYLQQKGGLCMGMLRARVSPGWWVDGGRINDLYGMRYALALLQRDEPDRALVSFYGKLAQGYTRDTFIGCEGSSIGSPDGLGRQMYLPPNSASNANFLQQLRYLLVQDYDLDDDGKVDTLRLAFATPRPWLRDGQRIEVKAAPTEFGEIGFSIASAIQQGHVDAEIDLPKSPPKRTLLRLRLPDDYHIVSVSAQGQDLKLEKADTIDLTGLTGHISLRAKVSK
jgi:hypothetical protein